MTLFAESPDIRDAWRCQACYALMYNIAWFRNEYGEWVCVPVEGAPLPRFVSGGYSSVCSVCFDMYDVIADSDYWKRIHAEFVQRGEKAKRIIDGFKSGQASA